MAKLMRDTQQHRPQEVPGDSTEALRTGRETDVSATRHSVLTIAEAAQLMRIGRNSAYEAARRGQIPTVRIGRRLLVPRAALERMLERAGIAHEDGDGVHGR